jgi:hypothetical protein
LTAYLLNWDKYEQEKPWTFSGMYFFHCRKIDKSRLRQLYEKHSKQAEDARPIDPTRGVATDENDDIDMAAIDNDENEEMDNEVDEPDDTADHAVHNPHTNGYPNGAEYRGQTKQFEAVEVDYEDVQRKDMNLKPNIKT